MSAPRRWPVLSGVVFAVIAVAIARPAHAADIGVVAADPKDPFVARLVLELEHLGFSVARGAAVATSRDVAVLEVADSGIDLHGARATEGAARNTRRLLARNDALKVAEEVRALMLPLVAAPAPPPVADAPAPPAPVPPPPAVDRAPATPADTTSPRTSPQLELTVGAGALVGTSTPGLGVTASAAFFPRALRARRWSFGAGVFGLYAAIPESVGSAAGSADVRSLLGGAEVIARVAIARPFTLDAAVGTAVAHVTFDGQANAPFTSRAESTTVLSPSARLRVQYMFTSTFGLFADARAGVAVPSVSVRFAGASVADWGGPWATFGGGAALAF